jgi:hypothetical protein
VIKGAENLPEGGHKTEKNITLALSPQYREMKIHFSLFLTVLNTTQSSTRSYV